jgi:hypothetical protein
MANCVSLSARTPETRKLKSGGISGVAPAHGRRELEMGNTQLQYGSLTCTRIRREEGNGATVEEHLTRCTVQCKTSRDINSRVGFLHPSRDDKAPRRPCVTLAQV